VLLTGWWGIFAISGVQGEQHAQHQMQHMAMMQNCPMKVDGADLSVEDTKDAIALTLTTKSSDVTELRRRAEMMAKIHSAPSQEQMHGRMIAFSVTYEEVPNGARLTLTPKDPAQLQELRATVRAHAEQMKKGDCSMMQGHDGRNES
jgi:hypothetical protein